MTTLAAGARIGPYEIGGLLGAGGMGEVYRARDPRLQRDVALKILPELVASDPERLARFEREAQMLAALNHPHIAAIYGLEDGPGDVGHQLRALVLELVEGETLAERIAQGPVPLGEALAIGRQLADALEAAHEQGIVHRDLKPSNIKLRPDGTVKVLDFGLAKLASGISNAGSKDPAYTASPPTVAPTITTPAMTQVGVIMGTAAYMSPEQAKGREADKRSDVWAFGAVFYEMLTGHRPFDGEDMSDTLASVLKIDPDWARLPADTPPALRTLLQRCLTKDRRQRVSDIAAARFVLTELGTIGPPAVAGAATANRPARWQWFVPAAVATVLTAIVVGAGAWALRPGPDAPHLVQFAFTLPEGQSFSNTGRQVLAISPDGTKLVYVANQRLYLRGIGELDAHPIPGTEVEMGAFNPVFSPNGQSIAYWSQSVAGDGVLRRIPVSGGAPSVLANTGAPIGASWGSDGILFGVSSSVGDGGVARVSPDGGPVERLITLGKGERAHGPQMLPDGRTVLFTFTRETGLERWDHARVVVESLIDHTRHVLVENATDGRYLPSGHLLYAAGGTMFAVPFDVARLEKTGEPVAVAVGVRRAPVAQTGSAHFAVSDNGTVMYRPGPADVSSAVRGLVIGDNNGASTPLKLPTATYAHPRVSPDGRVLAVSREAETGSDIWTYDLSGTSAARRLTFEGNNRFPIWSADSRRITFQSRREGDAGIWWQSPEGGAAERLTRPAKDEEHDPESWSSDGTRLLFSIVKERSRTLWVLTLNGFRVERFSSIESTETFSAGFSPDGKWVVYAQAPPGSGLYSPERGVFVEPYPARPGEKRQAPKVNIDYHPRWSPDGKTIYFIASASRPTVAVPITLTPSVSFGAPVELPRMPRPGVLSGDVREYDILHDGRVVSLSGGPGAAEQSPATEIRVMLNWFEELRRLAPTR